MSRRKKLRDEWWDFMSSHPELWDDETEAISSSSNVYIEHILSKPVEWWDWHFLSRNACITMADLLQHPDLPWDRTALVLNTNLKVNDILRNIDFFGRDEDTMSKCISEMCLRRAIAPRYLTMYPHMAWNYHKLSQNACVTSAHILAAPEADWDWRRLGEKNIICFSDRRCAKILPPENDAHATIPNLTFEHYLVNPDDNWVNIHKYVDAKLLALAFKPWRWQNLSKNMSYNMVYYAPEKDWTMLHCISSCPDPVGVYRACRDRKPGEWLMSTNPHLTEQIVRDNLDIGWCPLGLLRSGSISVDFALSLSNPDVWDPMGMGMLFLYVHITPEKLVEHADKPWNWSELSQANFITVEHVIPLIAKPWNWVALSGNPNMVKSYVRHPGLPWVMSEVTETVRIGDILSNPHLPWVWERISFNPGMRPKHIADYPHLPWEIRHMGGMVHSRMSACRRELRMVESMLAAHRRMSQDLHDELVAAAHARLGLIAYHSYLACMPSSTTEEGAEQYDWEVEEWSRENRSLLEEEAKTRREFLRTQFCRPKKSQREMEEDDGA